MTHLWQSAKEGKCLNRRRARGLVQPKANSSYDYSVAEYKARHLPHQEKGAWHLAAMTNQSMTDLWCSTWQEKWRGGEVDWEKGAWPRAAVTNLRCSETGDSPREGRMTSSGQGQIGASLLRGAWDHDHRVGAQTPRHLHMHPR